jgi:hypothetical protein
MAGGAWIGTQEEPPRLRTTLPCSLGAASISLQRQQPQGCASVKSLNTLSSWAQVSESTLINLLELWLDQLDLEQS